MKSLGEIIKEKRNSKQLSLRDFAKVCGLSHSYIDSLEKGFDKRSGKPVSPTIESLVKISRGLATSLEDLLNNAGVIKLPHIKKFIPLLGTIRAGLPILADENYEGELDIPADIEADFALQVKGDSMNGVGIYEGDYAICRQAQNASSGDIVVALRDDGSSSDATLKFFFNDNGKVHVLRAANPNYEDIVMEGGYRIAGALVAQLRKEPPHYRIYRDFISAKYSGYENWIEAIETSVQCGVSPRQVKELIELQWDMAKRMTGKK